MCWICVYFSDQVYKHCHDMSHTNSHTHYLSYTGSTELNAHSAPHETALEQFPSEVALEHLEMNTNDAYGTNTADIATTGNVAYMTAEDAIPAARNVAYGQVPPGINDCYDYVI